MATREKGEKTQKYAKQTEQSEEKQQRRNDDKPKRGNWEKFSWENNKMRHFFLLFNINESISWWNIHVSLNESQRREMFLTFLWTANNSPRCRRRRPYWERFVFRVYVLWIVRFCTIGHKRTWMTNTLAPSRFIARQSINSFSLYWRNIDRSRESSERLK